MAIISNFELLVKPIAPPGGPGGEVARVAVQGYFLEVSNLESRDITLIFRTRTSVRGNSDSVNTEFTATNSVLVYDITQDNNLQSTLTSAGELIVGKQLGHSVSCLVLPAGQTASIGLLPNVQAQLANPDLAIRGYTELVLSSNIDTLSPLTFSAPETANVLVSPEHRTTFIDPEFAPSFIGVQTDLDFDQVAYSLPTANGMARQTINTHANFNDPFNDLLTSNFSGLLGLTSQPISKIGSKLSSDTNTPLRAASIKVGSIPIGINYKIEKGNYVLEDKSTIKAIELIIRRRRIKPDSVPDPIEIVKHINAVLAGDTKKEAKLNEILVKLKMMKES